MNTYKQRGKRPTGLKRSSNEEGQHLETKIQRMMKNKEAIPAEAELIYTAREDGVLPAYDIRADRFELAITGHDKIAKSKIAKSEHRAKMEVVKAEKEAEKTTEKKEQGQASSE